MMPRRAAPWLLAMALTGFPVAGAYAQGPARPPTIPFDGVEVFRYVLNNAKLAPVEQIADLDKLDAGDVVLIVFGPTDPLDQVRPLVGDFRKFQARGGSLLVASDYAGALPEWGLRISGDTMHQDRRTAFRGESECPLIAELDRRRPSEFRALLKGLATNRPSYFEADQFKKERRLRILASFPDDTDTWAARKPAEAVPGFREPYILYNTGDADKAGRVMLIPGHGLFANGMLLQRQADNFDFAVDCVRWLSKRPDGEPRRHALFIVDSKVVSSFDVSLKPPIPLPTVQLVNQLLDGIQKEGLVFRLLSGNVSVRPFAGGALVVLTVLLLLCGAAKLAGQRYHVDPQSALLTGAFVRPTRTVPFIAERRLSQLERDALWEEGRALVRQWFFEVFDIPPADWDGPLGQQEPRFEVTGGSWFAQRRLRLKAEALWQLAGQRNPTQMSWSDLVRLIADLKALGEAVQEGRLSEPEV